MTTVLSDYCTLCIMSETSKGIVLGFDLWGWTHIQETQELGTKNEE